VAARSYLEISRGGRRGAQKVESPSAGRGKKENEILHITLPEKTKARGRADFTNNRGLSSSE